MVQPSPQKVTTAWATSNQEGEEEEDEWGSRKERWNELIDLSWMHEHALQFQRCSVPQSNLGQAQALIDPPCRLIRPLAWPIHPVWPPEEPMPPHQPTPSKVYSCSDLLRRL
jgi:hypothetical protein